jgi:hypothetical protein
MYSSKQIMKKRHFHQTKENRMPVMLQIIHSIKTYQDGMSAPTVLLPQLTVRV